MTTNGLIILFGLLILIYLFSFGIAIFVIVLEIERKALNRDDVSYIVCDEIYKSRRTKNELTK